VQTGGITVLHWRLGSHRLHRQVCFMTAHSPGARRSIPERRRCGWELGTHFLLEAQENVSGADPWSADHARAIIMNYLVLLVRAPLHLSVAAGLLWLRPENVVARPANYYGMDGSGVNGGVPWHTITSTLAWLSVHVSSSGKVRRQTLGTACRR
jgi:hypothetical protein